MPSKVRSDREPARTCFFSVSAGNRRSKWRRYVHHGCLTTVDYFETLIAHGFHLAWHRDWPLRTRLSMCDEGAEQPICLFLRGSIGRTELRFSQDSSTLTRGILRCSFSVCSYAKYARRASLECTKACVPSRRSFRRVQRRNGFSVSDSTSPQQITWVFIGSVAQEQICLLVERRPGQRFPLHHASSTFLASRYFLPIQNFVGYRDKKKHAIYRPSAERFWIPLRDAHLHQ